MTEAMRTGRRTSGPAARGMPRGPAATVVLALSVMAVAVPAARAMPPGADGVRLRSAASALDELRLDQAHEALSALASTYPHDPDVRFERALLRFLEGDDAGAARDASWSVVRAVALRPIEERIDLQRAMVASRDATRGALVQRSSDGRYEVRIVAAADHLIGPYALDALRRADEALGRALGVRLPGPIRLDVYPTASVLAEVSSLTVGDIERTGTVALCKWDRLMITSPRALVRGYTWADTIGHEFVHLMLVRASRDRAPVWVQEGIARFLERAWRGGAPSLTLDPASSHLLRRAARDGRLLAFDRLHPSIARLPTAEDAALAYAQVATFVARFHRQHGTGGLRAVVERIAQGADARAAFAEHAGTPWATLEAAWVEELRTLPEPTGRAPGVRRLQFRRGEGEDEDEDIDVEAARRALHLGDLLWAHQRPGAAASEYERAWAEADGDPVIGSRLARASLAAGRAERAIEVLTPLSTLRPDHAPTWSTLSAALQASGSDARALEAAHEALWLNPFDPQPHCVLADVGATDDERTREQATCRDLRTQ